MSKYSVTSGVQTAPVKVVLYGPEGIGKSSFAAKFPQPVFIDTEGGTKRLNVARLPAPTSWAMLLDEVAEVRKGNVPCRTLAMDIFGKSATDLNPLIEAGSGKLKELAEQAHEVGYVVDNETLQSFGELDDAMQKLDKQGDAVKRSFAEALLPIITAFVDVITAIPTPVLTAVIAITSIATVILLVVKAVKELSGPVSAVSGLISSATSLMDPLYIKILAIVAAVTALVAVIAVLIGKGGELTSAMGSITSATTGTMRSANSSVPRYATGTRNARGGMALVGENGPELVNLRGGERIYTNGQTRSLLGGDSISIGQITIDAKNVKEFNDIVNIARNEAVSMRQGVTK